MFLNFDSDFWMEIESENLFDHIKERLPKDLWLRLPKKYKNEIRNFKPILE